MTRFAAIPLLGVGLTLGAFGVIRGVMNPGPAAGQRIVLAIAPPVSEDARAMAVDVVKDRVEEKGTETRVVPAGDRIVVELGTTDAASAGEITALLQRTAKVELHVVMPDDSWPAADYVNSDVHAAAIGIHVVNGALAADDHENEMTIAEADAIGCHGREEDGKRHCLVRGDHVLAAYLAAIPALAVPHGRTVAFGRVNEQRWRTYVLDDTVLVTGNEITHVELGDQGVLVELTAEAARRVAAQASTRAGQPIAVVLDGKVKAVAPLPVAAPEPVLHLQTSGATEEDKIRNAFELKSVLEAGAVHPLSVASSTPFTRTVGFFPRAWLFLALALVSLVAGALVWRRRA